MVRVLKQTVPTAYHGRQVGDFLRQQMGCSGTLIKALKRQNPGIVLGGRPARTVDRLHSGDVVELYLPEQEGYRHTPVAMPLQIVYEDRDVLVVNKPPFMAVHHSANHAEDTLANGVAWYLEQEGKTSAFHAVNRLDRDTSGLVLLGLHSHAAARLPQGAQKLYYAVVDGIYQGRGVIDLPIRRKENSVILRQVGEPGQRAVTHWEAVAVYQQKTLLQIKLETGRTHQIRVHFSALGTPVTGDTLYSLGSSLITRQALHCGEITFIHPVTKEQMTVRAPLPPDMMELLGQPKFISEQEE